MDDGRTMSEENERESGRGGGPIWIMLVAALPILYVLSIGPVGALTKNNANSRLTVRAVYYPVMLLHDHTPLKKPLEAYARLWGWQ